MKPVVLIDSWLPLIPEIANSGPYSLLIIFEHTFQIYSCKYIYLYTLICALQKGIHLKEGMKYTYAYLYFNTPQINEK